MSTSFLSQSRQSVGPSSQSYSRSCSHSTSTSLAKVLFQSVVLGLAGASLAKAASMANTFQIVGNSGVSAQQLFLGSPNKIYFVDKTENNPLRVTSSSGVEHAAWGSEYDLRTNEFRAMDVVSNSFCAGGNVLGNGTWLNVGGNQAITWGGLTAASQTGGQPYDDFDGGKAIRLLDPCDNSTACEWNDDQSLYMTTRRWYPTLETLEDGRIIIVGGCSWGGYVNTEAQNNPTYEFFPSRGSPVTLNILTTTLPANLFSFVWLLPSGNLFIQTNWGTEVFDYKKNTEYLLDDVPSAVRTYPASGAVAMLPLTPANNWTATLMFCGGTDLKADQWTTNWNIAGYPADKTCVKISPDVSVEWEYDDPLDTGRSMGQFIILPDGRLWFGNGVALGTAGYGNESWAIGRSYGDQPLLQSWYFDPSAASGKRWSKAGVSTVQRLYHSSATLLMDGSILVSGSNPNPDYVDKSIDPSITYVTEYQVEIFYPDYWDKPKPVPVGMPKNISYGGDYFNVSLPSDAFTSHSDINATKFVIERTGFSTHAFNMGMRHVELDSSFTASDDGSAIFHVSQAPPNPAVIAPGPALLFCVVNGVPSEATWVMLGTGQMGRPPTTELAELPTSSWPSSWFASSTDSATTQSASAPSSSSSSSSQASGAERRVGASVSLLLLILGVIMLAF
ncbi:Immunoglobulin-like fold [Phaffia rhodozyma]|uniref:Immunoglobulin-like fold n=1 Tax=Phaffia rhodozyma TaxID=264483 RepID=A0A0F7SU24_PHARH|nr:Immunoglobulin-like fold [Phaffia rhodozyma]